MSTSANPSERVVMETNNAHDAYREARERLDERINKINHLVREHAERQFKNRANWGFTGDLNHVIEVLDEVIASLGTAQDLAVEHGETSGEHHGAPLPVDGCPTCYADARTPKGAS